MLLYLSAGTSYQIYDRQFSAGLITSGYQAQKFNNNLIEGLSHQTRVVSLSALTYIDKHAERMEETSDNTRYICIENHRGKLRKFYNINRLIREGHKIIRDERPEYILCDAVSPPLALTALYLSRKYKIPAVAIVTDLPEAVNDGYMNVYMRIDAWCMKKFSAYILITAQMNDVVNLRNSPYIVIEGSAGTPLPPREDSDSTICIYSGAIWKKQGLENLIDGFIKADIPGCELHFYGTGDYVPAIKEIEKKHPHIKYRGCVSNDELIAAYSRASLLINPRPSDLMMSKYSFPSKLFDYMSSSVPVLTTKLPGIPDEYFDYAFTIDREDFEGICEKLKEIFSLPKEVLAERGLAAREFIIQNKNNAVQSQRILDFLKSLKTI